MKNYRKNLYTVYDNGNMHDIVPFSLQLLFKQNLPENIQGRCVAYSVLESMEAYQYFFISLITFFLHCD